MCQSSEAQATGHQDEPRRPYPDAFPWELGVFDAHCHPTDTMARVADIPQMRARALTVMATRSQDQDLVAQVAKDMGVQGAEQLGAGSGKLVPSFGWHPWFSHQLYDNEASKPTFQSKPDEDQQGATSHALDEQERKTAHYSAVLAPSPTDPEFIASLPAPTPLSSFISSTRDLLKYHPIALVGEIGLDKGFRLPRQWEASSAASRDEGLTPGGREGRLLSPHKVRMQHQQVILAAQLRLAGELGRAVSVHGVQAHGVLFDTVSGTWKGHEREVVSKRQQRMVAPGAEDDFSDSSDDEPDKDIKKPEENNDVGGNPFPPRICLHSFSGNVEMVKQWIRPSLPAAIFFSFSTAVNLGTEGGQSKLADVVRLVPDDRILVESDLHTAGQAMDDALEDMYRIVCEIKGWPLDEGIKKIGRNYEEFIFG